MIECQADCPQCGRHPCGLCSTRLEDLGVRKGNHEILRNVNLAVSCGELTALIGPNGAGKSTLLKAVLGEVPHSGKLAFLHGGSDLAKLPRIGYVPQKLELDAGSPTSVLDLITATHAAAPVWLTNGRTRRLHAESILASVQAEHLVDRQVGALSGGELQRVLLALALDPIPQLLLLDEPVSGVDVKGLEIFYDMVADLRRRYDMSILLVSHDLSLVVRYADKVVFLDKTVLSYGTPKEVFTNEKVVSVFGEGVYRHVGMVQPG